MDHVERFFAGGHWNDLPVRGIRDVDARLRRKRCGIATFPGAEHADRLVSLRLEWPNASRRDRLPLPYLGTAFFGLWFLAWTSHRTVTDGRSFGRRFHRTALCHISESTSKEIASDRIEGCGDLFAGLWRGDRFDVESVGLANIVHG